jgi:hypothetical protein
MLKKLWRWVKRPKNPAGYVYYARLRTDYGMLYKLGYTKKRSLAERMAYGGHGDEKLIDQEIFFTYREDAWDVEQTLLDYFTSQRAFGKYSKDARKPLCGRGQSELFARDILGLDDSLYITPDAQTLAKIRAQGEEVGGGCLFVLLGLILVPFTFGLSLLFIAGGLSDLFGRSTNIENFAEQYQQRPVHPPALDALIKSLSQPPTWSIQY